MMLVDQKINKKEQAQASKTFFFFFFNFLGIK